MKSMILVLSLFASTLAFAGENDSDEIYGNNPEAAKATRTLVGGCANAVLTTNGENSEIVYTEPCNTAPTRVLVSDYNRLFKTEAQASRHCASPDYVQASYGLKRWKLVLKGFICTQVIDQNGGQ